MAGVVWISFGARATELEMGKSTSMDHQLKNDAVFVQSMSAAPPPNPTLIDFRQPQPPPDPRVASTRSQQPKSRFNLKSKIVFLRKKCDFSCLLKHKNV